ncbi:MAG TPA: T9SS type A sorting domain-containing protein, partial [Candidatus Cloacimonas sp.]|nr:T9SS type A sorting domain-containing protein [Candidatus Cloacimonas sp.]
GTITIVAPLFIGEITLPTCYLEYTIPANGSFTFNVNFQPLENIEYSGTLTINSDDPNALVNTIPVYGTGQPVANEDPVITAITSLKGCYPNPFNPETTIRFSVKDKTPVELNIYNILGQKVRTLINKPLEAGEHTVVWNGTDNRDHSVASGIYFYRMKAGNYTETKKMILKK